MNPLATLESMFGGDPGWFAFTVVLVVAIVAFVLLQVLNHRRRIAEARLKTAEALARQGALSDVQLRELITDDKKPGRRFIYFIAWLCMLGGIFCFCMAGFTYWSSRSYFIAGFVLTFLSTSIFATPFMFRELEKQGWI